MLTLSMRRVLRLQLPQIPPCAVRSFAGWVLGGWLIAMSVAAAPSSFTIAVAQLPHAAPFLIADAQGYFTAEGLNVKILRCTVGRVCMQNLLDGQAQFATVGELPIVMASFQRKDFAVLATYVTSGREFRIVVRKDRNIRRASDLVGKRIGAIKGASGEYFADWFLTYQGVPTADVETVALPPQDPIGPLVRGEVDAAALFDPHGREALHRFGSQVVQLPSPALFTNTLNLVTAGGAAGVRDDDVLKLLRAVARATTFMRSQPDEAKKIVAAVLKMDALELSQSWEDFEFKLQLGQPLLNRLEAQARWALREKAAPAGAVMPDYLDLIRTSPLRSLDPRAVRLVQ